MTLARPLIAADADFDGAPLLRREFTLDDGHGAVTSATLDVSALGVVEAWLDGSPVSDDLLDTRLEQLRVAPPRTRRRRHRHLTPTRQRPVLGLALGNGWCRRSARLGGGGGCSTATSSAGSPSSQSPSRTATSDRRHGRPTGRPGRARSPTTMYDGETIDARLRDDVLAAGPGFAVDGTWAGVHAPSTSATASSSPTPCPPVDPLAELAPVGRLDDARPARRSSTSA